MTITAALASTCTRNYTISTGDICDSISAAQNVSTYVASTYIVNFPQYLECLAYAAHMMMIGHVCGLKHWTNKRTAVIFWPRCVGLSVLLKVHPFFALIYHPLPFTERSALHSRRWHRRQQNRHAPFQVLGGCVHEPRNCSLLGSSTRRLLYPSIGQLPGTNQITTYVSLSASHLLLYLIPG